MTRRRARSVRSALVLGVAFGLSACSAVPSPSVAGAAPARISATNGASLPAATEPAGPAPSTGVGPSSSQVWTSLTWTEADPGPFSGPGNQYVIGGTAWSGGFLLVGEETPLPSGLVEGVVWSSTDGLHWQRIPNTAGTFRGSEIEAVAARGSTIVAVGVSRLQDGAQQLTPPYGLAWTSTDGIHWQRSSDPSSALGQTSPTGVVAGPDGFVAYGSDLSGTAPAILYSSDGVTWQRVADTAGLFSGDSVLSMAATGDGFAAIGSGPRPGLRPSDDGFDPTPGQAAAWWSADGRTWHASDVGSGGYGLVSVQPWVGGILRALGSGACGGCVGPPVVWYSIDGGRSGRMDTQSANTSLNETTSLVVEDRVVALEDPPVATWSADGQSWEPLPMTGASLADHAWLEIGRGDTIVAIAKFEPNAPAGLPNDQVDMLVYAGTLK